jgi:hypothetical protein
MMEARMPSSRFSFDPIDLRDALAGATAVAWLLGTVAATGAALARLVY